MKRSRDLSDSTKWPRAGAGVPASLPDAGGPDGADGTAVAAVGPRASADGGPERRTLGRPSTAAIARTGACGASEGAVDAGLAGTVAAGHGGRRPVPEGHRRFFREYAGGAVGADPP